MIRKVLVVWVSLFICYCAILICQGFVDQDSLYSLLIMMGVALVCATIATIRRPRSRTTTGHQTAHRRYEERHEFAAFNDSDVERLRRQWRADAYDCGLRTGQEYSPNGFRDDSHDAVINPATGLTMIGGMGGLDASGRAYGTGFVGDTLNHRFNDDAFRSFEDSSFKSWD